MNKENITREFLVRCSIQRDIDEDKTDHPMDWCCFLAKLVKTVYRESRKYAQAGLSSNCSVLKSRRELTDGAKATDGGCRMI